MGDQQTARLREFMVFDNNPCIIHAFPQKDDPYRRVFFEAKLPTCILVVQNGEPLSDFSLIVHPGNRLEEYDEVVDLSSSELRSLVKSIGAIPLLRRQTEAELMLRLSTDQFDLLGRILRTYQGEINQTTHAAYLSTKQNDGSLVHRGGNVQRYEFIQEAKQGEKLYVNEIEFAEKFGQGKIAHSALPRIGYQRKAALDNWRRLIFSPLPTPSYAMESISYYLVQDELSWARLALLNSSFLEWRFGLTSTNNMVSTDEIASLPAPRVVSCTDPQHLKRLTEEGRRRYECILTEDFTPILDFVAEQLVSDPPRSDVVHDLLAFLAEQMIDLNKRKQAEVKRFLAWVEETLGLGSEGRGAGGGIDSFTGKTFLQGYLGDYQKGEKELPWDDFEYRLHQNRKRYPADLSEVKGRIQAEYEASLAVLLPIKTQLAHTDGLIDQIVYKLYSLTDEEIAIIERPAYEAALSQAKAAVVADEKLQADPDAAADVMAEALLPAAQRLRQQVALSAERASLDQALPGWHLFPDAVATFLVTAEYNIHTQPDYLDFSTSIISYAKAVETMLYHRLFMRFRDESGASDADCSNRFLQQFMRGEKHLTLGSISIILQSSKEAALRAYIESRYPGRFFAANGLVERLNDEENLAQRNAAAHDQALTRQDAQSARAWAFGILGSL